MLALSLLFGAGGGAVATVLLLDGLSGGDITTQIRQTLVSEQSAIVAVAERVSPAIVTLEVTAPDGDGIGSGVIYSADGWIVTNKHVVEDATSIVVRLKDGRDFVGTIYGIDTLTYGNPWSLWWHQGWSDRDCDRFATRRIHQLGHRRHRFSTRPRHHYRERSN
jgi:hypothetical protein